MSLQHSQQKTDGSHNMSTVQTCAMQILCECQVIPSTTILNAIANTLPANLRTTPSDKPWTFVTGQGCLLELLGYWQCPIAWSASCNLSYPSCWDITINQAKQTVKQSPCQEDIFPLQQLRGYLDSAEATCAPSSSMWAGSLTPLVAAMGFDPSCSSLPAHLVFCNVIAN